MGKVEVLGGIRRRPEQEEDESEMRAVEGDGKVDCGLQTYLLPVPV